MVKKVKFKCRKLKLFTTYNLNAGLSMISDVINGLEINNSPDRNSSSIPVQAMTSTPAPSSPDIRSIITDVPLAGCSLIKLM